MQKKKAAAFLLVDPTKVDTVGPVDKGTVYIAWGDSDLSFDFHCQCGARPCGGGTDCLYLQCPKCQRIYEMPLALGLKEVPQTKYGIKPHVMED